MKITLTGRRLALAAVLVLAGALAPLAYSALGKSSSDASRPLASPVGAASVAAAQAPAAVADNPYQVFQQIQFTNNVGCSDAPLPAGQDFALESIMFTSAEGLVEKATVMFGVASPPDGNVFGNGRFSIPLETEASGFVAGKATFNIVVRPDVNFNWAIGDVVRIQVCVHRSSQSSQQVTSYVLITGQRLGSPTAARVASFDATSSKAGATLHWTTASETEILGFNVWRYRGAKGVKVNRTLIRAKRSGEPAGASYRYVDQVRAAKRGLTYRLQLVDLKGKRTWYTAFAIASK